LLEPGFMDDFALVKPFPIEKRQVSAQHSSLPISSQNVPSPARM
jgi:hypothetical protein